MNKPVRGTCAAFRDKKTGKQYTDILEVLGYYSSIYNHPSNVTYNKVLELAAACSKAHDILIDCLDSGIIEIEDKLK